MTRVHRRHGLLAVIAVGAAIAGSPRVARSQQPAKQPEREVSFVITAVAERLGLKVQPKDAEELPLGSSFTGLLTDPDKLARVGIRGMHQGARVTVSRIGPDRIRVEADELEPVPTRGTITLRGDDKGELTPVPPRNP